MSVKVKMSFDAKSATVTLKKQLDKVINNKQLQTEIGLDLVKTVKAQARLGKPLNNTRTFKDLSSITKQQREYLARFNNPGPVFSPEKANVTMTGQLLDGLTFDVGKNGLIELFFKGKRRPYFTGPKSKQTLTSKNDTNDKVYKNLLDLGFVVFTKLGIERDKGFMKRTNSKVKKYLRRSLAVMNRLNKE